MDKEFAEFIEKEELNIETAFVEEFGLDERKMTDGEKEEREEIVKKLKPKLQSFKDRYGDDAKKVMYATATKQAMEEVEIDEKKSATGYELYHKTFSDAMQHAYAHAKSKGFVVDPKEIDDKVATGPKKPSSGKTNRYSLKAGRKKVEIQVANLDNKRYELNMYIEGVELEEVEVAEAFKPHKMYDPKTGKEYDADTVEDHLKYKKMGYSHEKPLANEEIANSVGGGGIAGLDIGLTAKKKKEDTDKAKALRKKMVGEEVQRTTFAGKDVFIVDSDTYYNCRLGKKKYGRYEKYVGDGEVGQTIREYGLKYPRRPIILQNGESGPMLYLKYGRS